MYNWKPKTKKAEKLWNKRIKESHEDDSLEWAKETYKEQLNMVGGNNFFKLYDITDSRKILYITDGMYITKDGIVLHEEDAIILDF